MSEYSSYELQEWDYFKEEWVTKRSYPADRYAEDNALFAVRSSRASRRAPFRLLKDGKATIQDDPASFYDED